ncbi:heavy metal translocating P-type ATPase [Sphingomonas psychrotolerans]|uniref:Nitrogen fixation protein FixI n=1 Tax=Sphingomonas psychrotolerans TaxID=1327635 RepID=A0A2K8MI43_9SPHN|nr:heavy metal translocating P-type ATPase [Sphingomonas psychrotolerans]ATY33562.1 nitrogen fixation protein FixI [Sphingomonas psychrotolerans]
MSATAEHSELSVPGIRCASCISRIERELAPLPGIRSARVNFTSKRVVVDHDLSVTPEALRLALGQIGFDAQPIVSTQSSPQGDETRALLRAVAVAGFASMNIMLLSVSVWSGAVGVTRDMFHWLSALIALPTIAYAGRPFFKSAWTALKRGRTNMDVPISIGVTLASALSLFETITGGPHAYFDGAVMLVFFLLIGRFLDSVMRDRARAGVEALLRQTAPGGTVLLPDGTTGWLAADAIEPGMRLIVAAGERLAADGVVEQGSSSLDLSLITGESRPEAVAAKSRVLAGTLNLDAPLTVRVTAAGERTTIAEIARMMEAASQSRSRYVRVADRAARFYAPAVHTLAAASFAGWMLAGAGWHEALLIAVAVLIITCPCALGLAVPAAQVVAAGALMRRGILVKDGSALERLAEADTARFDKTGTLTLGRPVPQGALALEADEAPAALALARASRHPIARALAQTLEAAGVRAANLSDVREHAGLGIEGKLDHKLVRLGRPSWLGITAAHEELATAFLIDGNAPKVLSFTDALRPDALGAIEQLASLGIDSAILSGDRPEAVAPVAKALHLFAVARLTPDAKLETIERLHREGHRVLMVGDGLNDGPALAAGHVSMAPASASDVGQTAADFVFMGDSLLPVPVAVRAARRTLAVVRENFAIAIGYNALAVPLAIAGYVTPLIAALAMSGSSLIVVANALRLRSCAR